jgi:hypothetical protein
VYVPAVVNACCPIAIGVTELEAALGKLGPYALVAITLKV